MICNRNPNKIVSFCVLEELFFSSYCKILNYAKIDDEIKSKKFDSLKDFFFYFYWAHLGPFGSAHGLGWAGLGFLNFGPAQPKPENPGPCRPLV